MVLQVLDLVGIFVFGIQVPSAEAGTRRYPAIRDGGAHPLITATNSR